jgi:histidine ammonia-lyase
MSVWVHKSASDNLERILAIELMNAQAIEYRRPLQSSAFIEMFLSPIEKRYRPKSAPLSSQTRR